MSEPELPLSTTDDSPPVVSTASKLAHEEFLKDDRLFIAQKSLNRTNRPCKRARHHKTCHHGASCGQKLDDNDASEDEIYTSSDSQTSGDENSRKAQASPRAVEEDVQLLHLRRLQQQQHRSGQQPDPPSSAFDDQLCIASSASPRRASSADSSAAPIVAPASPAYACRISVEACDAAADKLRLQEAQQQVVLTSTPKCTTAAAACASIDTAHSSALSSINTLSPAGMRTSSNGSGSSYSSHHHRSSSSSDGHSDKRKHVIHSSAVLDVATREHVNSGSGDSSSHSDSSDDDVDDDDDDGDGKAAADGSDAADGHSRSASPEQQQQHHSSSSSSPRGSGDLHSSIAAAAARMWMRTPAGRPFTSAYAIWLDEQKSAGRSACQLLELLKDDMDLDIDINAELEAAAQDAPGASSSDVKHGVESVSHDDESGQSSSSAAAQADTAAAWSLLESLMAFRNRAKLHMLASVNVRPKLPHYNSIEDVCHLLRTCNNVLVLTGAGISVSSGIPDFRSENGLYNMLGEYDLPSPQAMFDRRYFETNPVPFFQFAKQLLPGSYKPSLTHRFIQLLDGKGKLLRNYTQNIDGLEKQAGVSSDKIHQCHGSFDTATCLQCQATVPLAVIQDSIKAQTLPICTACNHPGNILKPNIVFFGEALGTKFADLLLADRHKCDLVIVMGSSLQVAPVNQITGWVPPCVPQILINREVVGQPHKFDVQLLGDSDAIVATLCSMLNESSEAAATSELSGDADKWDIDTVRGSGASAEAEAANNERIAADLPPAPASAQSSEAAAVVPHSCSDAAATVSAAPSEAAAAHPYMFQPPNTYFFKNGKLKHTTAEDIIEALLDIDAAADAYDDRIARMARPSLDNEQPGVPSEPQ